MCGCEGFYVCPRCTGTPADPRYVDDAPDDCAKRLERELTQVYLMLGGERHAVGR